MDGDYDRLSLVTLQDKPGEVGLRVANMPKGHKPVGVTRDLGGRIQVVFLESFSRGVERAHFVIQTIGHLHPALGRLFREGQEVVLLGSVRSGSELFHVFWIQPTDK